MPQNNDQDAATTSADATYWLRRYPLLGKVLAVPAQLAVGEFFRDTVLRAAVENGLPDTRHVIKLIQPRTFRGLSAFTSLSDSGEVGRIVDVLGIRPNSVQLEEILKQTQARGREHVSFFGHRIQRAHISNVRRVSPRALSEKNYQRAIWSLRPLSFDPGTRETLLSECPSCSNALGWSKTVGINFCEQCPFRSVDLRDFPQPLVVTNDDEALNFFTDLVNPEVSDADFAKWRLPISGSSRSDLFQFAVRIAALSQLNINAAPRRAAIEPKFLTQAARALLGWPEAFILLAGEATSVPGDARAVSLWQLQNDGTLSRSLRGTVRTLRALTLVRNARASAANGDSNRSASKSSWVKQSGAPLRRPRVELLKLIRSRHETPDQSHDCVDTAVKILRAIPEAQRASNILGLPIIDVHELYFAGLLPHLVPTLTRYGFATPDEKASADLFAFLPKLSTGKCGLSLASARFALDVGLEVSWSKIFWAIFDGKIQISRGPPSGRGLVSDLYLVDPREIQDVVPTEPPKSIGGRVVMTQVELGMIMGRSRSTAVRFVEATNVQKDLTLERVRDLRRSWALTFELQNLLEIRGVGSPQRIPNLHRTNVQRIGVGGIFLWDRVPALLECGLSVD